MGHSSRIFSDLDFNFTANPVTGDVYLKTDDNAIKQAVKNLVLTNNYERPFRPEIGSQVSSLLFEQYSPATSILLKKLIENTIMNFEPRVELLDVVVSMSNDLQEALIQIVYRIINTQEPKIIDFTLRRTR